MPSSVELRQFNHRAIGIGHRSRLDDHGQRLAAADLEHVLLNVVRMFFQMISDLLWRNAIGLSLTHDVLGEVVLINIE